MLAEPKFRLYDHFVDLYLRDPDDKQMLNKTFNIYRRILFESDLFLLDESGGKILGINAENKKAGTSLRNDDDDWKLNFGFDVMEQKEIEEMLAPFENVEKLLKGFEGETMWCLVYVQEHHEPIEENEFFLKEVVLKAPAGFNGNGIRRFFKITNYRDCAFYTIKSVIQGLLSLREAADFLQKDKINAVKIFLPSLLTWLDSVKKPEPVEGQSGRGIGLRNFVPRKKLPLN